MPGRLENAACMSEHTSGSRRSDQRNSVKLCGRRSVLRCEAITDQTDTQKVRVTRHCQTFAGDGIVVARAGSTACQQTMSTPEEQMTMAIQQLNVQIQQFQETLATILQAARNELVEQVQNATSTTTHEETMKRADRLFKLRSYLGAVDQRNELRLKNRRHRDSTGRSARRCTTYL